MSHARIQLAASTKQKLDQQLKSYDSKAFGRYQEDVDSIMAKARQFIATPLTINLFEWKTLVESSQQFYFPELIENTNYAKFLGEQAKLVTETDSAFLKTISPSLWNSAPAAADHKTNKEHKHPMRKKTR